MAAVDMLSAEVVARKRSNAGEPRVRFGEPGAKREGHLSSLIAGHFLSQPVS